VPDCAPADLTATATTDRASYNPSTNVVITVTITSGRRCQFQPTYGGSGDAVVDDAGGHPIWERERLFGVYPVAPYVIVAPGQRYVDDTETWNQHSCPPPCRQQGGIVARGRYRAVPRVSYAGTTVPATFTLTT